jgi:hypothetical protein
MSDMTDDLNRLFDHHNEAFDALRMQNTAIDTTIASLQVTLAAVREANQANLALINAFFAANDAAHRLRNTNPDQ